MPNTPTSITCDGKAITQVTNGSAGAWTTNCGTLWLDAGATVPYVGTSVTSVYFKAQNKTSTGTVSRGADQTTVTIIGVFPLKPYYRIKWTPSKRGVITNVKRDGSRNGRILGDGQLVRDKVLVFRVVPQALYLEWEEFFAWHYPHLQFKYVDVQLNDVALYQFPESPEIEGDARCANQWQCALVWVGNV
jgi:hypothetical protein